MMTLLLLTVLSLDGPKKANTDLIIPEEPVLGSVEENEDVPLYSDHMILPGNKTVSLQFENDTCRRFYLESLSVKRKIGKDVELTIMGELNEKGFLIQGISMNIGGHWG